MIKTQIISEYKVSRFMEAINNFVADKNIIDIKYAVTSTPTYSDGVPIATTVCHIALIIYEIEENENGRQL